MAAPDIRGAFTALYTPFTASGDVDVQALRLLCDRQLASGIGLVPCGTTGETPTLDASEYDTVVRVAVSAAEGRVPVIAGTGSNNTRATIAATRHARELGADAALVVVPYYNKPPQVSLLAHFRAVADEGGLPVVLYNVPGRTGTNMNAETTLALSEHPNIVAIKEASANLDQMAAILSGAPEGFRVLSGDDAWTAPLMLLGGHGVVSVAGNVVPSQVAALVDAAARGDLAMTRTIQAELLPLFERLFCTANPIPVKRAAAMLEHALADVRLPLTADALTPTMAEGLHDALSRALVVT
ncbi:MAG: 4-hydroxy-tetrahydrodipicolinate synthase [Myxococcota bacterium]|jgi:4-hydroxy-tetrahydrodipicolinate synthase|nr:4-hydroxy-tetrahydrodipicolinate synthase [Myxococcota bacterium]